MTRSTLRRLCGLGLAAAVAFTAACATRPAPIAPPAAPRYPQFPVPEVPSDLAASVVADLHQQAWWALQSDDLRTAERGFSAALAQEQAFYPSSTGLGFVAMAGRSYKDAVAHFDRALAAAPAYVPALLGRGEALLALERSADALGSFEQALAANPTLESVRARIEVLRFRSLQEHVARARKASEAGRDEEARAAYREAIAASPESGFLHRELAVVEWRAGELEVALEHVRQAVALDPTDARALAIGAEIHERRREFQRAAEQYEAANAIDPSPALAAKIDAMRERAALASLPPEFQAIAQSPSLTRGQLAALIGVHLEGLVDRAGGREAVVITDTRDHWAADWILDVARAGIMEVYANHTFQPGALVRRGEMAAAVSRLLAIVAAVTPARAARWMNAQGAFSDLPPGHLSYPAASMAVASGVMPLEGQAFELTRPISGAEALAAIERLERLSYGLPPAR
jgi:tetratricopeptide (TPR) repeat protein